MEVKEANAGYNSDLSAIPSGTVSPAYKQTDAGLIPEDWEVFKLSEIGDPLIGLTYSPRDVAEDGILVLRSSNVKAGALHFDDNVFVTCDVPSRIMLRLGDILICVRNGSRDLIGKCAFVDEQGLGKTFGAFMAVFRTSASKFMFQQFRSSLIQRQIREHLGATINQITNGSLKSFVAALPPTKFEQEAIAEALSDADALIESLEQLIAKKRQIKQGTMQALLTGKRRLPGFTGEGSTQLFGEIAMIRRDRIDPRKSLESEFCVELEHIGSGTGSLLGSSNAASQSSLKSVFQEGNVLFGKLRAYLRKYWFADRPGVCSTEIWCFTPKEILRSKALLFYLVQMDDFIDVASLAYGTHMPRSDWNAVKEFVLRVPQDAEEQTAIATILTDMDTELAELETRLAKTRQLKQGMMQELLTGRIRLVQPALNAVPLPEKKETQVAAAKPHNQQINEAVVIAALVKQFGSEDWPLARVRRTKLTYLLHRHAEGRADGFLKKAAGPYDPRTRYQGPEGIALKKGYVQALHNGTYEGFVASERISEAETYFEKWYGADVMDWLERFRLRKTDELELLTTVDMAMEDIRREGKPISVEAVRQLIHGHPEWKPKLERAIFSDDGIAAAIAECQALFAS